MVCRGGLQETFCLRSSLMFNRELEILKKSGFDKEGPHVLTLKETMGKSATGKPSVYIA